MSADHTGCTPGVCRATDHYRAVTCGGGGYVEALLDGSRDITVGAVGEAPNEPLDSKVRELAALAYLVVTCEALGIEADEEWDRFMYARAIHRRIAAALAAQPVANDCRCGCPADMHIGEIGCPCALPGEPPCAQPAAPQPTEGGALTEDERESLDAILVALWQSVTESGYEHMRFKVEAHVERILAARSQRPEVTEELAEGVTVAALVAWLTRQHQKPLPTIPIGSRVRVRRMGVGTVVGRDGYGFDGVAVIFDDPAPRGFEDGCCAGVEECEVLSLPPAPPTPAAPSPVAPSTEGGESR